MSCGKRSSRIGSCSRKTRDFGDLVFRLYVSAPRIVLLRIDPANRHLKWTRLDAAIQNFGEALLGRYVVIDEARFRSRPLQRL